ncbi:MAG: glycosyltransferase family 2 protein [Pseudomarimonas sp.]
MTTFTIVLPTTTDRAPCLEPVLNLVRLQSLTDWELFIIGDGVDTDTREVIQRECAADTRLRFFDHPKHPRRGEEYRHHALAGARGRHVAYLCDRDLWFHDHLQTLASALADREFAHTRKIAVDPAGGVAYGVHIDLADDYQRARYVHRPLPVAMSSVAHTLSCYQRLPWGWRTTPAESKTDHYMWKQFLHEGQCHARSVAWPTLLYFQRGDHPGWPSKQRGAELQVWQQRLASPAAQDQFRVEAMATLARPLMRARQRWRDWLYWHPRWRDVYQRLRGGAAR